MNVGSAYPLARCCGRRQPTIATTLLCAMSVWLACPARSLAAASKLIPDRLPTQDGDLTIRPINHATLELDWKDLAVYVDPVGSPQRFAGLPAPGLVLITDIHFDHLSQDTLKALVTDKTVLAAPPAVAEQLSADLRRRVTVLTNGQSATLQGVPIEAVAAYNLTPDRLKFHPRGRGNGYVLTLGGKRIYISGDTEDTPELRALKDIDVAFLCMNLPYTMNVVQAAAAIQAFRPKIVYPYHYRGTDVGRLKGLLAKDKDIEVRLRDWYKP